MQTPSGGTQAPPEHSRQNAGSIVGKLKSTLDEQTAKGGSLKAGDSLLEGHFQATLPISRSPWPLQLGQRRSQPTPPLPQGSPAQPLPLTHGKLTVANMFAIRGAPPGAFKGRALNDAQVASFQNEWADEVPVLGSSFLPEQLLIRPAALVPPVLQRPSLAAVSLLDLDSQLWPSMPGPQLQHNPLPPFLFGQPTLPPHPYSPAPPAMWFGNLPALNPTAAAPAPSPVQGHGASLFAVKGHCSSLDPTAQAPTPYNPTLFERPSQVVRPRAASPVRKPQQLPSALAAEYAALQGMSQFGNAAMPQRGLQERFVTPSEAVRNPNQAAPSRHLRLAEMNSPPAAISHLPPAAPSPEREAVPQERFPGAPLDLHLPPATLRKLASLEKQRLSQKAGKVAGSIANQTPQLTLPSKPTPPAAVPCPRLQKRSKPDGGTSNAANLPERSGLKEPPATPGARKRQRVNKAKPPAPEDAGEAEGKLPREEAKALAEELCKAAGLPPISTSASEANPFQASASSAAPPNVNKVFKLPKLQMADAMTVAVCALGKAGGAPFLLQELVAVFDGWHAATVPPLEETCEQGGIKVARADSLAGWPGVKYVKALSGKEGGPQAAMAKLLRCMRKSEKFVEEGGGWKLALSSDTEQLPAQEDDVQQGLPVSLTSYLEKSGLLQLWQLCK